MTIPPCGALGNAGALMGLNVEANELDVRS